MMTDEMYDEVKDRLDNVWPMEWWEVVPPEHPHTFEAKQPESVKMQVFGLELSDDDEAPDDVSEYEWGWEFQMLEEGVALRGYQSPEYESPETAAEQLAEAIIEQLLELTRTLQQIVDDVADTTESEDITLEGTFVGDLMGVGRQLVAWYENDPSEKEIKRMAEQLLGALQGEDVQLQRHGMGVEVVYVEDPND